MKKTLVVLLILAVAGGVFAQVTPFGSARLDLGVTKAMGDNTNEQTTWGFGILNSGTAFGLKYEDDGTGAMIKIRGDKEYYAEAWTTLGPVVLKIGNTERDWAQWSSLDYAGDNNWAFGAGASTDRPFVEAAYVADAIKVYFGLQEARIGGKFLGSKYATKMGPGYGNLLKALTDAQADLETDPTDEDKIAAVKDAQAALAEAGKPYGPFPGFYLGGDYTMEDIGTFGAAFAGQYVGGESGEKGTFPLMFNLHGKITMVQPLSIGLNLSFYMAPLKSGLFSLGGTGELDGVIGGDEAMVLEAMLDVSANLDPLKVGLTAAFVTNFAQEEKGGGGMAMKIGFNAVVPVSDNFRIIPGIRYVNIMKVNDGTGKTDGKAGSFDGGISFAYSF